MPVKLRLLSPTQKVARAICRAAAGVSCMMDTERDRESCTEQNCRMMKVARKALDEAIAIGPRKV